MARLRQAFRATGVRVTCGADPLLALRSRRSFKEIGLSLPQQEIRPLAESFSFRCDSCLDHRGRVSFGSKNALCNIVPSLTALALYGVCQRLRRAIGFRVISQNASFFPAVARPSAVLPGHFTSFQRLPIQSLFSTEALLSTGTSANISLTGLLFRNTDDLGLPKM